MNEEVSLPFLKHIIIISFIQKDITDGCSLKKMLNLIPLLFKVFNNTGNIKLESFRQNICFTYLSNILNSR